MHRILTSLMLAILAGPAGAGAWPREKGTAFVSVSHAASTGTRTLLTPMMTISNYTGLYAEYGLTERLTLGLDAGFGGEPESIEADAYEVRAAAVFLRHPLWSDDSGHRTALQLGFGTLRDSSDGDQTRIIPALAWGYGFESRFGGGWMGIDASAEFRRPSGDTVWKADATFGLKPTEAWMGILQIQSGLYPDAAPLVRIAPSVVRRLGPRLSVQLGGFAGIEGDDSLGGKLALWLTF